MNILELCISPDLGGLELYVVNTCKILSDKDNVTAVIHENGKIKERLSEQDLDIVYLKYSSKVLPVIAAIKLAKIIDSKNINVIHMHWAKDLALAALAKKFSRTNPILVYTRQMQITRSKDDYYHRFIYKQVNYFVSITEKLSELARKFLSESDREKVRTLYYGVKQPESFLSATEIRNLRAQAGFGEDEFVVGLFGRIEEQKGQYLLINAIARLQQQGEQVNGLIVGHAMEQSYLGVLKQEVKDKGIVDNICFMDFVENPQDWMQACDVVVLATREETFGLVLVEAMHAGVPVIGTNSGGVPEIIEHGKTGLMFNYEDVKGLCDCILAMKNDTHQRQVFAQAGQEKARKLFDVASHYRKLREIFQEG